MVLWPGHLHGRKFSANGWHHRRFKAVQQPTTSSPKSTTDATSTSEEPVKETTSSPSRPQTVDTKQEEGRDSPMIVPSVTDESSSPHLPMRTHHHHHPSPPPETKVNSKKHHHQVKEHSNDYSRQQYKQHKFKPVHSHHQVAQSTGTGDSAPKPKKNVTDADRRGSSVPDYQPVVVNPKDSADKQSKSECCTIL